MTTQDSLTTRKNASVWFQAEGPNTPASFLGCYDVDDFDIDRGGINELLQCLDGNGGWEVVGLTKSAPEAIELTLQTYMGTAKEVTELFHERAFLFFLFRTGGRADQFDNWARVLILDVINLSTKQIVNPAKRSDDEAVMLGLVMQAAPQEIDMSSFSQETLPTTETENANVVEFLEIKRAWTAKGGASLGAKIGAISCDAAALATAHVLFTDDKGASWAATTTDPFAADEHIRPLVIIPHGESGRRIIVGRASTDAGNPAEIAYSDDDGTTWTNVNVGSTNGQFFTGRRSLLVTSSNVIWAVVSGGYIYKSNDRGISWEVVSAGTVTSEDLHSISFCDDSLGVVVGDNDTILKSLDGGSVWTVATATGGGNNLLVVTALTAYRVWIGDSAGVLYYSIDGMETWLTSAYVGTPAGTLEDMDWLSVEVGRIVNKNGASSKVFLTKDGGDTWEAQGINGNTGINYVSFTTEDVAYLAGDTHSAVAMIQRLLGTGQTA